MCLRPFAISKNQFMPLHVVKLDFATFEIFSCVYGSNLDVIDFLRSHILAYAHAHSHNTLTPHTHMQLLVAPLGYTYLLVKGGHCLTVHPSEIFMYPHSHSRCSSLRGPMTGAVQLCMAGSILVVIINFVAFRVLVCKTKTKQA